MKPSDGPTACRPRRRVRLGMLSDTPGLPRLHVVRARARRPPTRTSRRRARGSAPCRRRGAVQRASRAGSRAGPRTCGPCPPRASSAVGRVEPAGRLHAGADEREHRDAPALELGVAVPRERRRTRRRREAERVEEADRRLDAVHILRFGKRARASRRDAHERARRERRARGGARGGGRGGAPRRRREARRGRRTSRPWPRGRAHVVVYRRGRSVGRAATRRATAQRAMSCSAGSGRRVHRQLGAARRAAVREGAARRHLRF